MKFVIVQVLAGLLFGQPEPENDNPMVDDGWDCYTVEGRPECVKDIFPCHFEDGPEECRVILMPTKIEVSNY